MAKHALLQSSPSFIEIVTILAQNIRKLSTIAYLLDKNNTEVSGSLHFITYLNSTGPVPNGGAVQKRTTDVFSFLLV